MGKMDKYMDVKAISEMFGFKREMIQNMCNARNQRFAVRFNPRGKFWIDPEKFQEHIRRKLA